MDIGYCNTEVAKTLGISLDSAAKYVRQAREFYAAKKWDAGVKAVVRTAVKRYKAIHSAPNNSLVTAGRIAKVQEITGATGEEARDALKDSVQYYKARDIGYLDAGKYLIFNACSTIKKQKEKEGFNTFTERMEFYRDGFLKGEYVTNKVAKQYDFTDKINGLQKVAAFFERSSKSLAAKSVGMMMCKHQVIDLKAIARKIVSAGIRLKGSNMLSRSFLGKCIPDLAGHSEYKMTSIKNVFNKGYIIYACTKKSNCRYYSAKNDYAFNTVKDITEEERLVTLYIKHKYAICRDCRKDLSF